MTHIIITGGTIDKEYSPSENGLMLVESHIPEMLERGRIFGTVTLEMLMMIDSLDMTDADRLRIVQSCTSTPDEHVIVTHGTDTMPETARMLSRHSQQKKLAAKTIVLTGAMVPYSVETPRSDAQFNLGAAFAFANVLPPGVWVAMNGRAIPAEFAHKDRVLEMFIDSSKAE
jgi:L-asparaginase